MSSSEEMLVSILITSYNYSRYLGIAIDSALNQTYPDIEVIVVDDGSTDESPAIIASYGDRIVSRIKENGGPTSALNQAFGISRGQLICLLDADDVFEATKVQAVVDAARDVPTAYLVHHQLQMIDADGKPIHAPFPRRVYSGDLSSRVRRSGGWFPHAVSSGLAFRRSYAERLFPIPSSWEIKIGSESHRVALGADTYLAGPAALLAPLAGIDRPLTRYRTHQSNRSSRFFEVPAVQMIRYAAEMQALSTAMRETFRQPVDLQLDRHLDYQLLLCAAGSASRARTVGRVLRSGVLPLGQRCREALRVCANRGPAARRA
jgi:hypothetical protein